MGVWQAVPMDSLKFHPSPPCQSLIRTVGKLLLKQPVRGGRPAAVFYHFGHPTPYAMSASERRSARRTTPRATDATLHARHPVLQALTPLRRTPYPAWRRVVRYGGPYHYPTGPPGYPHKIRPCPHRTQSFVCICLDASVY
jgi:hypothetical protein